MAYDHYPRTPYTYKRINRRNAVANPTTLHLRLDSLLSPPVTRQKLALYIDLMLVPHSAIGKVRLECCKTLQSTLDWRVVARLPVVGWHIPDLKRCLQTCERFMEVKVDAFNMIRLLQKMFQQYLIEQYETSQALYSCKMVEGGSVSAHFMKMKSKDYKEFVINFDLINMELPFSELHEMLKDYEQRLSLNTKYKEVVMVRQGRENNNFDKGNSKIPAKKPNTKLNPKPKTKTKPKTEPPKPKVHPATDDVCHHCKEIGHWRRNCPKYLRELMDKKADMAKMS
ncbi:zinc finger, CCHC-type containing protein [Tanacetum coccineum]